MTSGELPGEDITEWVEQTRLDMVWWDLRRRLQELAGREMRNGVEMFLGAPVRWLDDPHWRCPNDHVSTSYLKTDVRDACLACGERLALTFPEDVDGPLP